MTDINNLIDALRNDAVIMEHTRQEAATALQTLKEENERMAEAIRMALRCTPSIGVSGVTTGKVSHVIQYDCGDPWEILRASLPKEANNGR